MNDDPKIVDDDDSTTGPDAPSSATGGEPVVSEATAHAGDAERTKYCNACHRRHPVDHPHFKEVRDDAAATVTGAKDAAELAGQVAAKINKGKAPKKTTQTAGEKLADAAAEQRRQAALQRWGVRMAKAPFTAVSLATSNPQWRAQVRDAELNDLRDEWIGVLDAFGFQTGGKIVALMSVIIAECEAFGAVYGRVKEYELTYGMVEPKQRAEKRPVVEQPGQDARRRS